MSDPFTCNQRALCEFESNPFANFSSELNDGPIWIGFFNPPLFPSINVGSHAGTSGDPIARTWLTSNCFNICESTVSQEEANLCALRNATGCQAEPPENIYADPPPGTFDPDQPFTDPPVFNNPLFLPPEAGLPDPTTGVPGSGHSPPPPPPDTGPAAPGQPRIKCNQEVTACVKCGDGSDFCYTVPACTFFSGSIAQANAIARSYAQKQATNRRLCLGDTAQFCCPGTAQAINLPTSGGVKPLSYDVVDGSLPPGLTMSPTTGIISGTPSATGNFLFTIKVQDSKGSYMVKDYELDVVGITSSTPTNATTGSPYSFTITSGGGLAPYTYEITSGSLPPGLTLNSTTGIISGTPT